MKSESPPYEPVYHFSDPHLFLGFIGSLARRTLIAPVKNDEKLRNLYFPGFRVTQSKPTQNQLLNAYKREILQRRNSQLANLLSKKWIEAHSDLTSVALTSIGIATEDPLAVNNWLEKVHEKLTLSQGGEETVRCVVTALSERFPPDDVRIFVSIIGHGQDQGSLRNLVESELQKASRSTPTLSVEKERLEAELSSAQKLLKEAQECRDQLNAAADKRVAEQQSELDELLKQLPAAESQVAAARSEIDQLSTEIARTTKALHERKQDLEQQQSFACDLSEKVTQSRDRIMGASETLRKQLDEADRQIEHRSGAVQSLQAQFERLHNRTENTQSPEPSANPAEVIPSFGSDGIDNNSICYQGIQRVFRNCVVAFLRERLRRIYPEDHISRVKKLFGEQWDKAAQNAATSRAIGGTATVIRDDYDLLGTNHFFEVFDRFYDKLFTVEAGQPSHLPKPVKTKFLGNLKTIKDGRDPLSHPVEEEISFEEAHHLLIEAKQILAWLGCETPAAELSALATKLDGGEGESLAIVRRLPSEDSIYQEFVGRGTVLGELAACFANPDNRRCLLAGDGGKGKSAVAYRFAQLLSSERGNFQLVIWLSAKRHQFQNGAISAIDLPDFATAEEAIDRLLGEYGATASDLSGSPEEKRRLLMEYLNTLPAFIIADDIDSVLDDYEVVSLFTHEIPHTRSAVLVTSRRDIPGIRSFVLKGFDVAEAAEFVRSRVRLYGLTLATFTQALISEIVKVTDGSPLYMDDLLRLASILDVRSALRMWAEKKGDEARRYALQRELEQLSPEARRVLIAAAVTDDPISFAELESVLHLAEERLVLALTELQTLFLFPKPRTVEGEQRFQLNLNTKKLVRLVESGSDMYARIERESRALAGKLPKAGHGVIGSLIRQALLRSNAQQHSEAETILIDAIEKYPNEADLRGFLGRVYRHVGRISDARAQFEAASKMKGSNRQMFLQWVRMEIKATEWSKAIAVAEKALKLDPGFYEMIERKIYAQRQAGFDFHRGLHREKAEKVWADAVHEGCRSIKAPEDLENGARQHNASMLCSIVICLGMLGRFDERDRWLERWEREHPDDPEVAREKEFLRKRKNSLYLRAV